MFGPKLCKTLDLVSIRIAEITFKGGRSRTSVSRDSREITSSLTVSNVASPEIGIILPKVITYYIVSQKMHQLETV